MLTVLGADCEYSALMPSARRTRIIVTTSRRFGILRMTDRPGTMIVAARIGRAAFLAPETMTSPRRGLAPLTNSFNIKILRPLIARSKIMQKNSYNSLTGQAVAVRVDRFRHRLIGRAVGQ